MIDIIDAAAPLVGPAFAASRRAGYNVATHRLLPTALFFVASLLVLIVVSCMLGRAQNHLRREVGSSEVADRRGWSREDTELGLYAYPLPSLQILANEDNNSGDQDTNPVHLRVRVVVPGTQTTTLGESGVTGMWNGGRALYDDVAASIVDTVIIAGFVWGARLDPNTRDGKVLILSNPGTSMGPLPSSDPSWTASGSWGGGEGGALVLAYKSVII